MSPNRFEIADRISALPPYLFAELDRKKAEVSKRGVDIIDLGVGDPDIPTPEFICDAMKAALDDSSTHRYPSYDGTIEFRSAVARWYDRRFGVKLDPKTEVISLIGAKEGIAHLPMALINPGDKALVPSPAYPVYAISISFAGGTPHIMPLKEENNFLPDLSSIPGDVARDARLMFLNYPNNPTGAVAPMEFFEEVVKFALENSIAVAHDAPYTEIYSDASNKPLSFLNAPKAHEVAMEFHSMSKTFCMTGWRVGFAVGNPELIAALGKVKTNIDSGVFTAIQRAACAALDAEEKSVAYLRETFMKRRGVVIDGLKKIGMDVVASEATFYVWARVPEGYTSSSFASLLLEKSGVVAVPGSGFGEDGEGFIRLALTVEEDRLREAVERIAKLNVAA